MICEICHREFAQTTHRQVLCSLVCRKSKASARSCERHRRTRANPAQTKTIGGHPTRRVTNAEIAKRAEQISAAAPLGWRLCIGGDPEPLPAVAVGART